MSENKEYPSILETKTLRDKSCLIQAWGVLLEKKNTTKRARMLEKFVKQLFSLSGNQKINIRTCHFRDKQIDLTAENKGILPPNSAGHLIYCECKYYTRRKAGAPECYKIAGHMLFNQHIKTAFLISISGFADTAYAQVEKFVQQGWALVLIDKSSIENFLKSGVSFEDWLNNLYDMAVWGQKEKISKFLEVPVPGEKE